MRSIRWRISPITGSVFAVLVVVFSMVGILLSQGGAPAKQGSVEHIKVHGKSLEGNLEMDSPDRDVFIYLPPGYATETTRRYPVVYLLHGYGLTAERWMPFANIAAAADKDIAAGTMHEMIVVNPDAYTKFNGSMYSSSVTTGDWESYIADDLVSYVDGHYRTIANRASRGLGGHSMGGYGTIRIGMKRPDVFSSMYIMSACCLLNNPAPPPNSGNRGTGPAAATGAAPAAGPAPAAAPSITFNSAAIAPPAGGQPGGQRGGAPAASGAGNRGQAAGGRGGGFANTPFAEAAAWSANPNNPPNFYDEPVKDGKLQPLIAAKWLANSPLAMIDQYGPNLKKYKAIAGDVGLQDNLLASNQQLDQIMTSLGVVHVFETYEGTHTSGVSMRMETKVLPFFSTNLAFTSPGR